MRVPALMLIAAFAASSCGGGSPTPSSGGGSGNPPGGRRLLWSQAGPSAERVGRYNYVLQLDGARIPLLGVSCTAGQDLSECGAQLPTLTRGQHVLQLSAIDPDTGVESASSAPLTINLAGAASAQDIRMTVSEARGDISPVDAAPTCTTPQFKTCLPTALLADDIGPVKRIAALPDGRVVLLFDEGLVRVLPSGVPERLDIGRSGVAADISDIAVDPDFAANRFVYVAAVSSTVNDGSSVSIVRLREVGDRFGQAATIVADLPVGGGRPAISIGQDHLIYVAVSSSERSSAQRRLPDGLLLRFTREGRAAGNERLASPVLAIGDNQSAAFGWLDGVRLLTGSELGIGLIRVDDRSATWPAAITALSLPHGDFSDVTALASVPASDGGTSVFLLQSNAPGLYRASLGGVPAAIQSLDSIDLGRFEPLALATAADGATILTAAREPGATSVRLLQVRPQ